MLNEDIGTEILDFAKKLYPICRSITGPGVRKTLSEIKELIPELVMHSVPSGTHCFDWAVPQEWNISDAYLLDPDGEKIIDFKKNNLHVLGYSEAVNVTLSLEGLQQHLFSLPEQPDAIPYVTSYYSKKWGFCLTDRQRKSLKPGMYQAVISAKKFDGVLNYGEIVLPGSTSEEVFISTYVCHPSMANNELSGPTVVTYLVRWLKTLQNPKYTYRIVFIPETIGSIAYLSKNHENLKKNVVAGFNVTCIGDDRQYSYLPSRQENTLADRVALHVLKNFVPSYVHYSYLERGSDERQYCSPGIDLPIASIMRTKYGEYPEYHTSLDNFDLVTASGLNGGYQVLKKCIECLESNETLKPTTLCEPQLGKYGLYPTLSTKDTRATVRNMMNLLAYADGTHDLISISEKIGVPLWELTEIVSKLKKQNILTNSLV